jgi:hypothetical protein
MTGTNPYHLLHAADTVPSTYHLKKSLYVLTVEAYNWWVYME